MGDAMPNPACRVIGEARDCNELVDLYRQRKVELGLTDAWFDDHSGLTKGHLGKLFGDAQVKTLGPVSIHALNCSLAVKFIVVVDENAEAIMRGRWEGRERPAPLCMPRASKRAIERFKPIITRENNKAIAPLGGLARAAKLSPRRRSQIARRAARARWSAVAAS
jgi:hypothetical protein